MSNPRPDNSAAPSAGAPPPAGDAAGWSSLRVVRNVLANWVWYGLVLVSGFILPRFIDRQLGQDLLGVWDLGWSLVFYISLLALGVSSAVQRHVARARALADWDQLNAVVNSCLAVLLASGLLGVGAAIGLAAAVPWLLPTADPALFEPARWVVLLLAICAAEQIPGSVFNAVITGFERYDVLNVIRGARDLAVLVAMLVALFTGGTVVTLAIIVLSGEILGDLAKLLAAHRLCPTLRVHPRLCRRDTAREMLGFGAKTAVQALCRSGLYQTNSLLVAVFLGPAALAVYARQRALVMHLLRFVKQYAQVFIPASSALDAQADTARLQHLLIQTSRYGLYVTLPAVLIFLVLGGPLLQIWMGDDYQAPAVLAILAAAHLLTVPQLGAYSILLGMGKHGWPAAFEAMAAVVSLGAGALILGPLNGGLVGAAWALALPLALSGGVLLPACACRAVGLSGVEYVTKVAPAPLLAGLPLAACLLAARFTWPAEPLPALLVGVGAGGLASLPVYWRWVVPTSVKERIGRAWRRRTVAPAAVETGPSSSLP